MLMTIKSNRLAVLKYNFSKWRKNCDDLEEIK